MNRVRSITINFISVKMSIKKICFPFLLVLCVFPAYSQMAGKSKTFAIVVGIANYHDPDIPKLKYANRDAEAFADFLKSRAGGTVPEENIVLLVDSAATSGAVYNAIDELRNNVKPGDLVYFYFSGHGDIENKTVYKNGFLICYDSPPTNYNRFSLSMDDLNEAANTLSAQVNANVVLITDACRSGKLAGSYNKGNFLVGDQFRAAKNKEIRITSSSAEQLSNENEKWGEGRGVFSWYLVKGLNGLAEQQPDGIITLGELKSYLEASLSKDPVLKNENLVQTPVLKGNPGFAMAKVDPVIKEETLQAVGISLDMVAAPVQERGEVIPSNPLAYFSQLLKTVNLEKMTDSFELEKRSTEQLPFIIISTVKKGLSEQGLRKLEELEQMLRSDEGALKRFNNKLAVAFDETGQRVIDQYLKGDEAELERRRYYNIGNNGYAVYPKLFATAIKLTQPGSYLRRNLEIKLHYFTGVTYRLQLPEVVDERPLIEKALAEQKQALALVDNAPYVFNELGLLYSYSNKLSESESWHKKAIEGAPTWVIPHANLVGLYTRMKKYDLAMKEYETALTLDPGFQGLNIRAGILYEQQGNLLAAEELFRNSIHQNSRHYLPFERLGSLYIKTTQYALADSFIYEAEIRKKGFHFKYLADAEGDGVTDQLDMEPNSPCDLDTLLIRDDDPIGQAAWGILLGLTRNSYSEAEKHLKKAIVLDRSNPLVYHYLGKILFEQQRWQEAELNFRSAVLYHLDSNNFKAGYRDSILRLYRSAPSAFINCWLGQYFSSWYEKKQDYYYLGALYERWGHLSEAADQYARTILIDKGSLVGYYKLWNAWEKLGRYADAEKVILAYGTIDQEQARVELYGFYNRMIGRFPEEGTWYYKQGRLLYELAKAGPSEEKYSELKLKKKEADREKEFAEPDIAKLVSDSTVYNVYAIIDGPGDYVYQHRGIVPPYGEQGIAFLKKADSLLRADDDMHAEINDKVGDLFTWLGLPYPASTHYRVAVDSRPDNATVREKLADSYSASFQLRNALAQLDSLLNRRQIDFPHQLMMARYLVHSGDFVQAQQLLTEAEKAHPYPIPGIIDLNGLIRLLNNEPGKALDFYVKKLELFPEDSTTMYSIARIYAKTGQNDLAWKWLDKAVQAGFNYPYVLKFDPYLEKIRRSERWKIESAAIEESIERRSSIRHFKIPKQF